VVNRAGEFDGDSESLGLHHIYDNKQKRAVSVDSAAIGEAVRKVYNASALGDEIESGK
jgi:hypothetical protein